MSNKKAYETAAHANDGYVTKDAPLILFRGALDHCQAEIIVTQAMLDQERTRRSCSPGASTPPSRRASSVCRTTCRNSSTSCGTS